VRPALLAAAVGRSEAALLDVAGGSGFQEGYHAFFGFLATVETAVGVEERAFAQFALLLPPGFAGLEVLARPALAIGVTIEMLAHFDHAAMMVHHDLVGIHLRGRELASFGHFEKVAADAVAGGDIHVAVGVDGRGNHCGGALAGSLPQHGAVLRRHAGDALGGKLHVLPHAAYLGDDD